MFHQIIAPVGESLGLSFVIGSAPIVVLLVLLGIARRPAWQASSAGLLVALILAVVVWKMPPLQALDSVAAGAAFALWPIMWIVFNALALYNVAVESGRFAAFREWMLEHLPNDRRIVLVVVGFSFGCLLEGITGFGTPVAITSALLITLGFPAIEALVFTLIFNTAPVAFGALGTPVTTLGAVTQLSDVTLGAMIGRQLPMLALLLPFYVIGVYGGVRAVRGVWPALLVAGASFALTQFVTSNYIDYALTDVLSSLISLLVTVAFLKIWKVPHDPAFALLASAKTAESGAIKLSAWQGWTPWLVLTVIVVGWVHLKVNVFGQVAVQWPGLHNAVFITAYDKPYAAIWNFQPLATGTAILISTLVVGLLVKLKPGGIVRCYGKAARLVASPAINTVLIVGLAYLLNYSGIAYTLGIGIASLGAVFVILSAFLGWLAVFLSGSDTSGNALFGNLQVVAARQLGLNPILMAATNSSGGVLGKMISPQNICTGTAVTDLKGREGAILARTFKHSIILTLLLSLWVVFLQYVAPGLIPG